ncbi:MAG: TldD/PmbA family protein [Frankiaceae bacterium]|nr:TldD/PmbA family protein [Frankiaceae bacterium]MBV9869005.1 TldD/PmbA family protein [Frankiaceae bacterium]
MSALSPQELVERALAAASTDGCIAIATDTATTNLRWANNTLTTNGVTQTVDLTIIATVAGDGGVKAASVSRNVSDADDVAALVEEAASNARGSSSADDAAELITGDAAPDWAEGAVDAPVAALSDLAHWLGDIFGAAGDAGQGRYGYAEHSIATTYLGSSTGLRLRHAQPSVRVELTGRTADGSRSAWSGQGASEIATIDLPALEADVVKRLAWSERRIDLPAGRYETLLPPSAVADLLLYSYWSSGALDAYEGQSVFAKPGGGTRVGERLSDVPLTLRSDPSLPGHEAAPFVIAGASSRMSSVFDNGAPIGPIDWIRDGVLTSLIQTRHSAQLTGLDFTPFGDNLELVCPAGEKSLDDLIAGTRRGLLLTCLWYIREVDPQTLLLTGLTRDGVFLVEDGEVTGAVNNFRFNESPVGMLKRVTEVGTTQDTLAREFGDYFTRTRMPAMRIEDFNMSSVSQAS